MQRGYMHLKNKRSQSVYIVWDVAISFNISGAVNRENDLNSFFDFGVKVK